MTVKVAQGDPAEFFIPVGTLVGGSAGHPLPLGNLTWIALASISFRIAATATAGTRQYVVQVKDAQGNVVLDAPATATSPASSNFPYAGGPGVSNVSVGVTMFVFPIPSFIPPGSSLVILDSNNVDPNDAIATGPGPGVMVYTQ